jgi:hypothetical protein
VPNTGKPNFFKHTLLNLKTQRKPKTLVVEDFNIPLSQINRSFRQKISKETLELNDTIELMDLTDVYRVFHLAQHTFSSAAQGTFSKIDHILGPKQVLTNKKIEITPCILSDDNTIKLELNNKRNSRKYSNNLRLNNTLLYDEWVIEEVRKEIKRFLKLSKNEITTYQNL